MDNERGRTCRRRREGKDAVLAMVLIEDVLTLFMMIEECWYMGPSNQTTTAPAAQTQNISSNTVVAAEREPAIAIRAMIVGQHATRPACWMPGTIQ